MKTNLKTAPQILEHYVLEKILWITPSQQKILLEAMRHYARVKSDKSYELGYQTALKQLTK